MSPVFGFDQIALASRETTCGLQKAVVTSVIFVRSVVIKFQGLVGVLFSRDEELDGLQVEFAKVKGVFCDGAIKGGLLEQSDD